MVKKPVPLQKRHSVSPAPLHWVAYWLWSWDDEAIGDEVCSWGEGGTRYDGAVLFVTAF